jgi:hypothetical protein
MSKDDHALKDQDTNEHVAIKTEAFQQTATEKNKPKKLNN